MSEVDKNLDEQPPHLQRMYLDLPRFLSKEGDVESLDQLLEIVTDLDFLAAKISHKELGVQPLVNDYDLALQPDIEISEEIKDNLKLIQDAIRMSANVLADDPSQLPSQLLGHLMPYRSVDESEFQSKSWTKILLIKVISYWKQPPEFVETFMLFARELTFNVLTRPLQFIDEKLPSRFSLYPFLYWWYKFVEVATNWIVKLIFIYPCVSYQVSDLIKKRYFKQKPPYFVTIDVLLEQVEKSKDRPWLRPLTPSLTPAGEILIRTLSLEADDFLINAIAITPDGTKMVSASQSLIVWDMKTGTILKTLTGHKKSVNAVVITSDGKQIVSGSNDSTIKIWDIETGKNIDTFIGHQSSIRAIAITPDADGKNLVSASHDTTLKVWDLQTGQCLCTCIEHQKSVGVLAIHPDGDKVISGDDDKRLILWNLKDGRLLREIKTFEGYLYAIAITNYGISLTKDEKKLLVATRVAERDNPFEVCDISTGKVLKNLTADKTWLGTWIKAFAIDSDETKVVAASEDRNQIKIWDLRAGIPLGAFEAHNGDSVSAVAITPDGKQAVTGAHKTLKIWDLTKIQTKSKIKSLTKHSGAVNSVAITPDGKQAISGSEDGSMIIWDVDSQKPLTTIPGYGKLKSIAITPDGQKFVSTFVSNDNYKGVTIWNIHNTKRTLGDWKAEKEVETVAITPDSKYIVSGLYNSIIIWDLESGNIFRELDDRDLRPITSVAITPDGKYIIAGTVGNLLFVWDFKFGHKITVIELLNEWNGHDSGNSITSIAVTPNSQQLICASSDNSLRLWDIAQGIELKKFSIHSSYVYAVVVTPSGKFAVSASADETIKVWHLQTGKVVASFSVETSVYSCAVAADGLTIVAGDFSGRVHFLRLEGIDIS